MSAIDSNKWYLDKLCMARDIVDRIIAEEKPAGCYDARPSVITTNAPQELPLPPVKQTKIERLADQLNNAKYRERKAKELLNSATSGKTASRREAFPVHMRKANTPSLIKNYEDATRQTIAAQKEYDAELARLRSSTIA